MAWHECSHSPQSECHYNEKQLLGLTFAGAVASHHSPAGCIWAGDTVYVNQIRWDNTDLSNMTVGAVCVCKETALDEQALMEVGSQHIRYLLHPTVVLCCV